MNHFGSTLPVTMHNLYTFLSEIERVLVSINHAFLNYKKRPSRSMVGSAATSQ